MMQQYTVRVAAAFAAAAIIPALCLAGIAQASTDEGAVTSGSASADGVRTRGATETVGGGTWSYGVDSKDVFSAYDNQQLTHSTAVKSSGKTTSSGKIAKGTVAWASRPKALFGNTSYWNIY